MINCKVNMELASKTSRCKCYGMQIMVPPTTQVSHCPLCQTTFSHTNKLKDLLNKASSNTYNTMASTINSVSLDPPWVRPRPWLVPVSAHGRKRAVLCGVSYHGQKYKLDGSVNDVKCMRYLLINRLGFPNDSIIMLTEEESDPYLIPTKRNMTKALQWLVQGCQSGDSLVFHFSGHGSQQLDYNRDEVDGYDEVLWPVDHHTAGTVVDDEINATIVRQLPPGAKLHAIVDACHSGTILDLQFVCKMNRDGYYIWEDHSLQSATYKGTSGGLAVSFSACDDNQIAVDTTALSGDNTATGILTYSFIQAVQNEPGLTYGRLLKAMRQTSRNTRTGCPLRKVFHPKSQEPQLSSSEKFHIHTRQFIL